MAGTAGDIPDGGTILIPNALSTPVPVVTMTSKWVLKYDAIKFFVFGRLYCDALVPKDTNELPRPESPVIILPNKEFIGWDKVDGDVMSGVDKSSMVICTTEAVEPVICDTHNNTEIVCYDNGIEGYGDGVNARIADLVSQRFSVLFNYMRTDGIP